MQLDTSFGQWLKQLRRELDLTQDELARRVSCATATIQKIEADERRPSRQIAERLADCLELTSSVRDTFLRMARVRPPTSVPTPPARPATQALGERNVAERGAGAFTPASHTHTPGAQAALPLASALPSGTVTFLFTDIESSTQLWEQHPGTMPAALARHDAILRDLVASHGGLAFKTVGDAICAAFAGALAALAAALDAQRVLAAEAWGATGPLHVRIALHSGLAEARDGDYFGQSLNRAARLLAAGHGGQILLSLAAEQLVRDHLPSGVELRDLGTHRLKDLARPEHIFQLVVADLPADFPTLRTLDAHSTNLPAQPTALIGREQEVADLCALLRRQDVRLVTLTGPGGTGKTRLALQIAAELLDLFADGVFFVDLAPISAPDLVVTTIAQALGVTASSERPADQLKAALRHQRLLLLLDNYEQVLTAAPLVAELLAAVAGLKVLVTSRAALHLRGEKEFPVPPLALPPTDDGRWTTDDASAGVVGGRWSVVGQYAAVQLFIQRALDIQPNFAVTNQNAPAIAEICYRLDGLPLAIELAAARVKLFTPDALLARLSAPLALLTGGARDLPARQQTIRSTIDWSYNLLSADEQRLFRQLGVFVGGFSLQAAEGVLGTEGRGVSGNTMESVLSPQPSVLDGLAVLLDHSLLVVLEPVAGESRFVMLETIREYALERLRAAGEEPELCRSHAEYLLDLVEALAPKTSGPESRIVLEQLAAELPNIRAAFAWAGEAGEHDLALQFASALLPFWLEQGNRGEGRAMVETALSRPGAGPPIARAQALNALGRLSIHDGGERYPERRAALEESLAIFRRLGDLNGSAEVLNHLAFVELLRGDLSRSEELQTESLRDSRAAQNPFRTAWALAFLAHLAFLHGDETRGNTLLDESQILFRKLKSPGGRANGSLTLAWAAYQRGDGLRAVALLTESVQMQREGGSASTLAWILLQLGCIALRANDKIRAVDALEESLAIFREVGEFETIPQVLNALGEAALACGDPMAARAQFRESHVLCGELGNTWDAAGALLGAGHVALAEGDFGAASASYTEALTLFAGLPDWDDRRRRTGVAACLEGLAGTIVPERATRLYGAAAGLRAAVGSAALHEINVSYPLPGNRATNDLAQATVRATLGDAAFAAAWAAGQALTLGQAIAEALNC